MKKLYYIIFLFFIATHSRAERHASSMQLKILSDTLPKVMDSLIGFATTDFYAKMPEGALGDLVCAAMKASVVKQQDSTVAVAFVLPQSIKGGLRKGEIYRKNIHEILPFNDSLVIYELAGNELLALCNKMANLGGIPCAGVSFKILNMQAVDILINKQSINKKENYRVVTTKYTAAKMKPLLKKIVGYAGLNMQEAVVAYIVAETKSGNAIYGYRQHRILYKE